MKKLLFVIAFFFLKGIQAQTAMMQGIVVDASKFTSMEKAVVSLIRSKDSILIQFTRSDKNGFYKIKSLSAGSYFVKITYPGFADYIDTFSLKDGQNLMMDTAKIINKSEAIKSIMIKGFSNGIRVNGDTTEFIADYFKTNPGASVEELLKKLPGIQVNKNGEITAQGVTVKKILVDGEEFFADDPTVATKYLRADMIDKVQLYDHYTDTLNKKEEDKTKTLNLTLKQDKKKGYFGKAEAGSNFNNYSNAGIFAAHFNKKLKTAVYSKNSNFENSSIGWGDQKQFGGAATQSSGYGSSFNDQLDNRGIPYSTSGGANFSNTWDSSKTKVKLNASYRFAHEGLNGKVLGNSRYFLPDTSYSIQDTTTNKSLQDGHRANVSLTIDPDSFNKLTFSGNFALSEGTGSSNLQSATAASRVYNSTNRNLENSTHKMQFTGDINWIKNFRRKERNITTNFRYNYEPTNQSQNLISENYIYTEAGLIQKLLKTDQHKENNKNVNYTAITSTFKDNINKYYSYNISYQIYYELDKNRISTFNRENGTLTNPIDSLSNKFNFTQFKNVVTFSLRYNKKKHSGWLTASGGNTNYLQNNLSSGTTQNRNFINFFPSAGWNYSWKKQSNLELNYSGSTQAPSMSNIQPIINNINPFNLTVGNANLRQSYTHNIALAINSNQTIKGRYFYSGFGASLPRNAFVNSTTVDSNAVRRNMTVNANGCFSINGYMYFSQKLNKLPLYLSISANGSTRRNVSFNNNQKNLTNSTTLNGGPELSFESDNVSIDLEYKLSWNRSLNSLQNNKPTEYIIQTPAYDIEVTLPYKFKIVTTGDFNMRPASAVFSKNRNVYYLTAGIGKYFGKNRNLEVSFNVKDILNQNIGFDRNITSNLVTEQVYTQLARYWLLKIRWNFSSTGGAKKSDDD